MMGTTIESIYARTRRHVAPLIELPSNSLWQGATIADVVNQATMTFVAWNAKIWAITNAHVVASYRSHSDSVLSVALKEWQNIPARLKFVGGSGCRCAPCDLAIFEWFDRNALMAAGKEALDAPMFPNLPGVNENVLFVGYPGTLRKESTPTTAEHGLLHVTGTVRSSGHDSILVRDTVPSIPSELQFGGISGGPLLRRVGAGYSLSGIVYEGLKLSENPDAVFGPDVLLSASVPISGPLIDYYVGLGCV